MIKNIDTLLELQEVHLELDAIRAQLNQAPDQLQEIERKRTAANDEIGEIEEELNELAQDLKRLETENQEESERVLNYDKRLKQLKTNREYQSLLREIGFARKLVQETEAEIKAKQVEQTQKETQLEELRSAVAGLNEDAGGLQSDWTQSQTDLVDREKELVAKEKTISAKIDINILGRYKIVRKRHPKAVVPALGLKCGGCHMALPPQQYNRLLKGNDVVSCPSCARILYVKPEPEEQAAEEVTE